MVNELSHGLCGVINDTISHSDLSKLGLLKVYVNVCKLAASCGWECTVHACCDSPKPAGGGAVDRTVRSTESMRHTDSSLSVAVSQIPVMSLCPLMTSSYLYDVTGT